MQFSVNINCLFAIFEPKDRTKSISPIGYIKSLEVTNFDYLSYLKDLITMTNTINTDKQYDLAIFSCKEIFIKKANDYGTAWRVLRTISIVDQIFIKAQRIRTIQQKGEQKIADDRTAEFKGIINYAVIGLIQLELTDNDPEELPVDKVSALYDSNVEAAKRLMQDKNHDYGEAWRSMSQESLVDLILMKLQRIRQILSNEGKTIVSEGIDANYLDIINYAAFALILLSGNSSS